MSAFHSLSELWSVYMLRVSFLDIFRCIQFNFEHPSANNRIFGWYKSGPRQAKAHTYFCPTFNLRRVMYATKAMLLRRGETAYKRFAYLCSIHQTQVNAVYYAPYFIRSKFSKLCTCLHIKYNRSR